MNLPEPGQAPALIIDVGGGSVELIVGDRQKPLLLESCKLGAARMTARYVKSDPISVEDLQALLKHYDQELAPVCLRIAELKPAAAIGTSGTLENIAAMCSSGPAASERDAAGADGWIEREALERLVSRLLESRAKDRTRMRGLDEQRQDQIVAGTLLLHVLFRRLNLKRMAICGAALREGILVDYVSRHQPDLAVRRAVPDPRRRSVLDLARRCNWHADHSRHVANLTVQLFDATKSVHGLGPRQRELIEYGALLHDIGWHIGPRGHHKHSMYLILNGALQGLSPQEVCMVANIARYHRKSPPKTSHTEFQQLGAAQKQVVRVGAALLRICDGLDRSHSAAVEQVRTRISRRKVRLRLTCRGDTELEVWSARRKVDLFCDVFGRAVVFERIKR